MQELDALLIYEIQAIHGKTQSMTQTRLVSQLCVYNLQGSRRFIWRQVNDGFEPQTLQEREVELVRLPRPVQILFHHSEIPRRDIQRHQHNSKLHSVASTGAVSNTAHSAPRFTQVNNATKSASREILPQETGRFRG